MGRRQKTKAEKMKVRYDDEVDAAYIQLSSKKPKAAIEIKKGLFCTSPTNMSLWASRSWTLASGFPFAACIRCNSYRESRCYT